MILNTYLKSKNVKLKPAKKMILGLNLIKSYKARFTEELKKVSIQENGVKMDVFDYPKSFFEDERTIFLINSFFKKYRVKNNKKTSKYEKV